MKTIKIMIHDLQQQKEDLQEVVKTREKRIADHKLSISAEKALIKADQNTIDVITNLIAKIGPSSEAEAPVITTDGREL